MTVILETRHITGLIKKALLLYSYDKYCYFVFM